MCDAPWLFNLYMDGVVREVNARVLKKGLQLLRENGGRFEINQFLLPIIHKTQWLHRKCGGLIF